MGMTKSTGIRFVSSIILVLAATPTLYLFGLGLNRTIAPVADPQKSGNLLIQLEAADFQETVGIWPIVSTVSYPNVGPIRGEIRGQTQRRL